MTMYHESTGRTMSDEDYRAKMLRELEKSPTMIFNANQPPEIGEIQFFAGLPLRCIRHVSLEEARKDFALVADPEDVWPGDHVSYFEVEVAD